MKYALLVLAAAVTLVSCDKKRCWTCTIYQEVNGKKSQFKTPSKVCDNTKSEIEDLKKLYDRKYTNDSIQYMTCE